MCRSLHLVVDEPVLFNKAGHKAIGGVTLTALPAFLYRRLTISRIFPINFIQRLLVSARGSVFPI